MECFTKNFSTELINELTYSFEEKVYQPNDVIFKVLSIFLLFYKSKGKLI